MWKVEPARQYAGFSTAEEEQRLFYKKTSKRPKGLFVPLDSSYRIRDMTVTSRWWFGDRCKAGVALLCRGQ